MPISTIFQLYRGVFSFIGGPGENHWPVASILYILQLHSNAFTSGMICKMLTKLQIHRQSEKISPTTLKIKTHTQTKTS
jgi:hypothetical protein